MKTVFEFRLVATIAVEHEPDENPDKVRGSATIEFLKWTKEPRNVWENVLVGELTDCGIDTDGTITLERRV